ncbi:ROK family protein [Kineococcus aurantiacus]|uniref:Putative NBD/HSP70 family sugar kinase n=1 Tax=Kineococcus aurantiacus TaxID=37633 RepID=A0A7Y9J2G4_9ACTN|nr:ROK family protein [Kineococcus aurantiacus]NYD24232.1 putative NBD/HSP70 family sugar kinase [Kineococcus aurantiacus]
MTDAPTAPRARAVGAPTPLLAPVPDPDAATLAGVVDLVRAGRATTRPALVDASRLSRKVVTQRVEQAIGLGLLEHGELAPSSGGRPSRTLRFRAGSGHVYAALIGAAEITAAVLDLGGTLVGTAHEDWPVAEGPEPTLQRVHDLFTTLARRTGVTVPWGIGVGVPGPVEYATGRLVAPPIMPGWNGFSVRSWLRDHYDAPVWVDNDVNLMALGEWTRATPHDGRDMLFVKVGSGIGAGLVVRGRVLRGDRGAAGEIGHVHVSDDPRLSCRCGRTGCLEAIAGGWALERDATERARAGDSPALAAALQRRGHLTSQDVGRAALAGDPVAAGLIDASARAVAEVTAHLVNFSNPGTLVLGGGVLRTGTRFLDVMADTVRQRCTDLAVRDLVIRAASLDHLEGVVGAGLLAAENLLNPVALGHWVEDGQPLGHAATLQRLSAGVVA